LGILNELYFDQLVFVGYNNWRHQHGSLVTTTGDIGMVPWVKKLVTSA
jgi:restriction endonuclease Mrr